MKINYTSLLLGLLLPVGLHATTLPEAVKAVTTENPRLSMLRFETEASREAVMEARGALYPRLSLYGSAGAAMRDRDEEGLRSDGDFLFQREARLTARQLLYDGGGSTSLIRAAEGRAEVDALSLNQLKETLALQIAEIYLDILRLEELMEAAEENVKAHQATLDKATKAAEAGGGKSDAALVRGRLGLAESTLRQRSTALDIAQTRYQRLLGEKPEGLIWPPVPESMNGEATDIITDRNWNVLASKQTVETLTHEVRAAERSNRPRFDLELSGGVGEDVSGIEGPDNRASALLVVSWDLFDRSHAPRVKGYRARLEASRFALEDAQFQANEDTRAAQADLQGATDEIRKLNEYSEELNDVLNDYNEQFSAGRRSLLNVLDIRNEQLRATSALIDVRYTQHMAAYKLLAAQGKLVEVLVQDN